MCHIHDKCSSYVPFRILFCHAFVLGDRNLRGHSMDLQVIIQIFVTLRELGIGDILERQKLPFYINKFVHVTYITRSPVPNPTPQSVWMCDVIKCIYNVHFTVYKVHLLHTLPTPGTTVVRHCDIYGQYWGKLSGAQGGRYQPSHCYSYLQYESNTSPEFGVKCIDSVYYCEAADCLDYCPYEFISWNKSTDSYVILKVSYPPLNVSDITMIRPNELIFF